jgi:hypothetical protein
MFSPKKSFFVMIVLLMPLTAQASPFCVAVTGLVPECIYEDASSCKTRAMQEAGVCIVNTNEITSAYGTEKFCIVNSSRVPQCIYADRNVCEAAQNNGSVCVNNNFENVNGEQPDPFANDPNRNY